MALATTTVRPRFDDLKDDFDGLKSYINRKMIFKSKSKSSTQNDLKSKSKISDDLKSRFKIKWFEIIPNTEDMYIQFLDLYRIKIQLKQKSNALKLQTVF